MTQLRSVTRHMGSHSVTCYPTQVNTVPFTFKNIFIMESYTEYNKS